MKRLSFIIISILLFSSPVIKAQDTINLLNGKQILATKITEDTSIKVLKYDISIHDKILQRELDKLNIYSIYYSDNKQKIIYRQDSALGYNLSEKDMSSYILGEREAIKNHKVPWITVSCFVVGVAAEHYAQFWGLLAPVVCATAFGVITPRIHASPNISFPLRDDFNFKEGYKYTATRKKVKNALFGSIVGFVACGIFEYSLYLVNK
jgi:hypothetical protein